MRKSLIIFGILIAGLAFGASQPWMTKPYQQWDENDVREVLSRSPWVKQSNVTASWGQNAFGVPEQIPPTAQNPQTPPQPQSSNPKMGGYSQGTAPQQPNVGQQQQQEPPEGRNVAYVVRWNSAQTVRDALARQAILSGRASQSQVEQYVDQQPATYQVFVGGTDMTPFAKESNDTLKSEAYLEVKPSKQKVAPATVEIVKSQDGKTIQGVLFSFAKQAPNGQPLIASSDKQAHFDCKLKLAHLDANFDLHKMVGKNGQEL